MSIVAMIKGKLAMQNNCIITNQPSFFASFESTVTVDTLKIDTITISSGDIVFHLLSTSFVITNSVINKVSCNSFIDTIF